MLTKRPIIRCFVGFAGLAQEEQRKKKIRKKRRVEKNKIFIPKLKENKRKTRKKDIRDQNKTLLPTISNSIIVAPN